MNREEEVVARAELALAKKDAIKDQLRQIDEEIRQCCKEYGEVMRVWGWSEDMLRRAVNARKMRRTA